LALGINSNKHVSFIKRFFNAEPYLNDVIHDTFLICRRQNLEGNTWRWWLRSLY